MPSERSEALLGRELTTDENSVRGTLVAGLTAKDIALLDMFEGNARISLSYCSSSYPKHAPPPFSFCVVSGGGALRLSCSLLYCAAHLGIKKKQEYVRSQVLAHPLGPFTPVPATSNLEEEAEQVEDGLLVPAAIPPLCRPAAELAQTVPAQSYVWCVEDSRLDNKLWSYEEFARKNAWKWTDEDVENEDYSEVNKMKERRRRAR